MVNDRARNDHSSNRADALIATLLDEATPPQLASAALQGLVSIEPIEDRILATVITARQLAPLLRSPYEGLIYYMLEARQATRGRFAPNCRLSKPSGKGSYEVDLLSDDAKLVIEIDGAQHKAPIQIKRDEAKQRDLEALGYRVRRFSALQVSTDPVGVWHLKFVEIESGKRARRPQLDAALAACKKQKAKLVVAKLDRLSRNVSFLLASRCGGSCAPISRRSSSTCAGATTHHCSTEEQGSVVGKDGG